MERYKICPFCKRNNKSTLLECVYCEADLTNVRIKDVSDRNSGNRDGNKQIVDNRVGINPNISNLDGRNRENNIQNDNISSDNINSDNKKPYQKSYVTVQGADIVSPDLYRVCDCGYANLPNARKCGRCGEDISDIQPAAQKDVAAAFSLVSIDALYHFQLQEGETVVGRHASMKDYLADKSFVSRIHARFVFKEGCLRVENLSETNFTYVNNVKVPVGEAVTLHIGDEVGLGGIMKEEGRQEEAAYFRVSCK